jgi:uncharacterized protein
MSDQSIVPSPCIGVCSINEATGYCQGCFRTLEEIRQWWDMDDAGKSDVIKKANERENSMFGE